MPEALQRKDRIIEVLGIGLCVFFNGCPFVVCFDWGFPGLFCLFNESFNSFFFFFVFHVFCEVFYRPFMFLGGVLSVFYWCFTSFGSFWTFFVGRLEWPTVLPFSFLNNHRQC